MELKAENVQAIFTDSLANGAKETVEVEGIVNKVSFSVEKMENHQETIIEMLNELPSSFHQNSGGGMSFLNACMDKDGNQWTGLHATMEQLFLLGMAIKRVKCLLPREVWPALPGGMPYYVVIPSS